MTSVNRRAFITGLGAVLAAPHAVEAQQAGAKSRIGYLSLNPRSDTEDAIDAFRAKLRDLGYLEGQNLSIEYRYADGKHERLLKLAAELVRLKVDVIFAYGTPAARAAKNATSAIPIVFGVVSDPLAAGLVASLTLPGGNVTGVTPDNPDLSAKRVSILKEAIPSATRMAVLANPDFPATPAMLAETRHGARVLGIGLQVLEARDPDGLAKAFGAMTRAKANAVIILADPMFIAHQHRIAELAMSNRIPAIYHLRDFVESGGLISYGADYAEMFQQSAVLIDKILKGAKPANIPVEHPWHFALVINLKTAKTLGLTLPPSLLLRADQVIE
jgi:putative tryptophan/tyrosine transport system substrate-binding protein